ncbi:MAG: DUF4376 domain-containing protein [Microbacteriaceae bacterium]|nr:DUF4376 domain-containing protein [Burkholderiaceae bacterium]
MFFYLETQSSTHIAVTHHKLARAEITPDFLRVNLWLDSWPNEAARLDGQPACAHWFVAVPAETLKLDAGLLAGLLAAVIATPDFAGATQLPDASVGIAALKTRKWAEVKAERDRRADGTFTSGSRTFDADPVNLVGAALDAYLSVQNKEAYAQPWVLADNSAAMLTAAEMIAAGRACKAYLAGLWVISQGLRDKLNAAQTTAEVDAITWPA